MPVLPFTIIPKELGSLGPDKGVELMRRLIWAEAARIKIPPHCVTVSSNIYAPDGGIDAEVTNDNADDVSFIPVGHTCFQFKATGLSETDCKKEVHVGGDQLKPLKSGIHRVISAGGNYVLVLLKELTPNQIEERVNAVKEAFTKKGYPNVEVHVLSAEHIASIAERFPSIVAWLKPIYNVDSYSGWKENSDVYSPRRFVSDEMRSDWIREVRKVLRAPGPACPFFRVIGLPGIGKTRLVFETLAAEDLSSRVIYVTADSFIHSALFSMIKNDKHLSVILVVDECDSHQHQDLVRVFANQGSRLAVISMSYDSQNRPNPPELYYLDPLENSIIEEMLRLEFPNLFANVVSRLAEVADGYPRIAVLLAQSYLQNPGDQDEYIRVDEDDLMDRLIGGHIRPDSELFRTTKKVLRGIALFDKIGYGASSDLDEEAKWLASYVGVEWSDFREVVHTQKKRGLIQGKYYIYVTPIMLRLHLLREWWESYGFAGRTFEEFVNEIPEVFRDDLLDRFVSTIKYVPDLAKGEEIIRELLDRDGIFADGRLFEIPLGGKLFLALAEASPGLAVTRLRETLGCWSKEQLLRFREGRQDIVWALERISIWREHFQDAARLLLLLAEAENARNSNNASGVFVGLFSPAPGLVAPTESPPEDRFPVLRDALSSDSAATRKLGLRACSAALQTSNFSRFAGAEYQGLHRVPELWTPETYGELFEAYRRVWELLREHIPKLHDEEKREVASILLERSRGLIRYGNLADMVVETVAELVMSHGVDRFQVLEEAMQIIRFDGDSLPETVLQKWERLRDSLVSSDYHSRMVRYVGADLYEDSFDDENNVTDKKEAEIRKLARESLNSPNLLMQELNWLTTSKAVDGYRFGYELANLDLTSVFLDPLIEAQRKTEEQFSFLFLGGYFAGLAERDLDRWESEIEALADSSDTQRWVCSLTWRSRMPSEVSGQRIVRLAETGVVYPEDFGVFVYGGVIRKLSPEIFHKWIDFLLGVGSDVAISNALELFYMYYLVDEDAPPMPMELAIGIISYEIWFQPSEKREQSVRHHWSEIAKTVVEDLPHNALGLAEKMLSSFGISGTIMDGFGFNPVVHGILDEIVKRFPEKMWRLVTQHLGPPIDTSAFYIREWLRGEDRYDRGENGALSLFPPESIWQWVDQDVENRAWYVATLVPKSLWHENEKVCLAREVLVRYGDRDDVLRNFSANYSTEGWMGSESLHHRETQEHLLAFKKEETDLNVIRWIDQHVFWLEEDIKRAELEEERRGF